MPKLILVSNRLPVTAEIKKNGEFSYSPSTGGLATGLSSLSKKYDCVWVGFNGLSADNLDAEDFAKVDETMIVNHRSHSVPLSSRDVKLYYNGFSNKTIWPLFHYFPLYTSFEAETWEAYEAVNMKFYQTLAAVYEQGDLIWVHDYHLMLLPQMIRRSMPGAKIGFFLHIPFPSYEVFRLMPWRKEILTGLLGADLIGFHTFAYVRHFLGSIQKIIGTDHAMGQLKYENRIIKSDIFPMGIDYPRYSEYTSNRKISREISEFKKSLGKRRMILSMDRLDFTKGIVERLNAFERFLEKYPEYREKVQMVLVAVPSRTKVDTYMALRNRVNEKVGLINGRYNTLSWSPIQYLYRSLPFETIMTLYHCADVCLVTPLRDGMNLVAKEYIAARIGGDGMLVLSEMAGSAEELGEALIVNPNNREEVADAIAAALSMNSAEQHRKINAMQHRLKRNDVFRWAASFVERLSEMKNEEEAYLNKILSGGNLAALIGDYLSSRKRLIMLDYDGTLVPFFDRPDLAVPDRELLEVLSKLAQKEQNDVVINSGRNFEFLERHFSHLPLTLVSEHGAWIKLSGDVWKEVFAIDTQWKQEIRLILELYCDRTPGSFIEEKEFSLAWHYRRSDAELASIRAMELKANILPMIANYNLGVMEGNKILEIKSLEVNKGKIAAFLMSLKEFDFILGIGDDTTDEDLFASIPETGYSVKVGYEPSKAKYYLPDIRAVRQALRQMATE